MSIKLTAQSGGSVALDAPTQTDSSADLTLTLPVNTGTSGQVIQTNGSGTLSFATPTGDTAPAFHAKLSGTQSCLLYTSPSPRDRQKSRMPSSA